MLNFKSSSLFLIATLIIMASVGIAINFSVFFFLIPVFLYLFLVIRGSAKIDSGFFTDVYCSGDPETAEVSLTFDDGPHPEHTPVILDILNQHQIKATFFMIGEKVNEYPDIVRRISAEGHLLGNHSLSHSFFFDLYTHNSMVKEIRSTNRAVEKLVQKRMFFFRPPYGVTTPVLARAMKTAKVTPVGWSLRSLDTVTRRPEQLVKKINSRVKNGDIILLHDTKKVTADALSEIIRGIEEKGFKIVRMDGLLKLHSYG